MKTKHTKTYGMPVNQCLEGYLSLRMPILTQKEGSQISNLIFHLKKVEKEAQTEP